MQEPLNSAIERPAARAALIDSLRAKISAVLDPLIPSGAPCALLDFPNYANVGDSAIWLGERAYLRRRGLRLRYVCERETYSAHALATRLGDGVILLQGGGNLGDLWPHLQRLRERIITAFPRNRIIQMPQTIHFGDLSNLARARGVFDAHPDLHLLVRDYRSLELAQNEFRTPSVLCPDMALGLGALPRPPTPRRDVLWLSRSDIEAAIRGRPISDTGIQGVDWLTERRYGIHALYDALVRQRARHPRALAVLSAVLSRPYDLLARARLRRGCRILSQGRAVITDRLHGHILSLLMGIPHVLLDNSYGKVRSFYETWTRGGEGVAWADSSAQALRLANQFVASPADEHRSAAGPR